MSKFHLSKIEETYSCWKSTYWMAGLAPEAVHFFKFILILVLYSLCMTVFVRRLSINSYNAGSRLIFHMLQELPVRHAVPKRRNRHPSIGPGCSVPDDIRGLLCSPQRYTPCSTMVSVVLSAEICAGGAFSQRGWLWLDDTGYSTGSSR